MSSTSRALPFQRVTVVGVGLIGGSFALALREKFPNVEVTGHDRSDVIDRARHAGIVTHSEADLAAAVHGADLVYIALPIGSTIDALPAIAAAAKPDALVTDAASTKTVVCQAASRQFTRGAKFLGGHPMAGKESSGVEHASGDLFEATRYALIADAAEPDTRVKAFAGLIRTIGAEPVWCDAETHDWAVGIVSHLPQMLSVALASVVRDETDETGMPLTLAGPGLKDSLRLAGSPYTVWRDVALTNRENIARALDRMTQAIEHLRTRLGSKDLGDEFSAANELYKFLQRPH